MRTARGGELLCVGVDHEGGLGPVGVVPVAPAVHRRPPTAPRRRPSATTAAPENRSAPAFAEPRLPFDRRVKLGHGHGHGPGLRKSEQAEGKEAVASMAVHPSVQGRSPGLHSDKCSRKRGEVKGRPWNETRPPPRGNLKSLSDDPRHLARERPGHAALRETEVCPLSRLRLVQAIARGQSITAWAKRNEVPRRMAFRSRSSWQAADASPRPR